MATKAGSAGTFKGRARTGTRQAAQMRRSGATPGQMRAQGRAYAKSQGLVSKRARK